MIFRLLAPLLGPSNDIRDEVTAFLAKCEDPRSAWIRACGRRQAAEGVAQWSADAEVGNRSRYWGSVVREIERQTGYRHQADITTRHPTR